MKSGPKKSLLVTLASEEYLDSAKQVISSAYFKGGWDGNFMLLAYEVPEDKLGWFKEKGILIERCGGLLNHEDISKFSHIYLSKFLIFKSKFKKWNTIVYLDADIIVRYSIKDLKNVTKFSAAPDWLAYKLKKQFLTNNFKLNDELKKRYKLETLAFNAGVMAFPTSIIYSTMFNDLMALYERYKPISRLIDQPILNLFFCQNWGRLSGNYNVLLNDFTYDFFRIDGTVLHFAGNSKLKIKKGKYYQEWLENLKLSDKVNLVKPEPAKTTSFLVKFKADYLNTTLLGVSFLLGTIGKIIYVINPKFYRFLKNETI